MVPAKSDLQHVEQWCERLSDTKASKDFVNSELSNLKGRLDDIEEALDETSKIIVQPHNCNQQALLGVIHQQNEANAKSIRKLYVWQAGIGISLLVFFLTVGVAALRFVDNIAFSVQANAKEVDRLGRLIDKNQESDRTILKDIVKDAIKDLVPN